MGAKSLASSKQPTLRIRADSVAIGTCGLVLLASLLVALAGCGVSPVTGGTPGVLRADGQPLGDVQVRIYRRDADQWLPIGFGDTAADGSFHLVTSGAQGPLQLVPGEYRCVLESVGAPVRIPRDYADIETTPLLVSWSAQDNTLTLDIPQRLIP
jgi:hypothetical protein